MGHFPGPEREEKPAEIRYSGRRDHVAGSWPMAKAESTGESKRRRSRRGSVSSRPTAVKTLQCFHNSKYIAQSDLRAAGKKNEEHEEVFSPPVDWKKEDVQCPT
ncbi:unnamed protein product [Caretta caretta]